jgi:hypothetical protein
MAFFSTSEESGFDDLVETNIEVVQTSSYDETGLKDKIESTGMKKELFACALQLAVVGWGRDNYGDVTVDGEKRNLVEIFDDSGVFYDNAPGVSLEPTDLTPRRLIRVFRFQISRYMGLKNMRSFLLRKYGADKNSSFNKHIFPGAEHLITDKKYANVLLECYTQLDETQGSHFVDRIRTVFRTRDVDFD